jgi:ribonucleotide reductase alpha subunit|tara:strand:+ start:12023 stop:14386 length:2364 start_codon:yes stop_codon:yes gene_type:complete
MRVTKRDGTRETVSFDKVLRRIQLLSDDLRINGFEIAQKVCNRIYDGVLTSELDELTAYICSSIVADNPDYDKLASRITISNHQKKTSPSFSETIEHLHKAEVRVINHELYNIVQKHKDKINSYINYQRDYLFDYFGFKTLERAYLLRVNNKIVERPQDMFMRVALGIHGNDIKDALETYDAMSTKMFLHATPTLFNYGTLREQGSSCFLLHMNDDSINGIYESLAECAAISKYAGGIGIHIHNIRGKNSVIRGTNGNSDGIVPMLRVFNSTARYVNQSGKRNGSIAVYLEPWHCDIEMFLDMKKNHGNEEDRARDLFYGLWIPDLFMERVKSNGVWSLMCPDKCKYLSDVYGDEFYKLYTGYEEKGMFIKQIKAQDLWIKILESQIETGTPYMLYKDAVNKKSNQSNLGIIKSSNLCTEIVEYTSPDEIAVCNLASLCLPSYIVKGVFDFELLGRHVKILTKNLNKIIDKNFYPLEKARTSNLKHRPIGIGVQGLSDTYMILKLPYESREASELNKKIFETIYYYAMEMSMEISKKRTEIILETDSSPDYVVDLNEFEENMTSFKGAYSSFDGSPLSNGKFQFDLWGVSPSMYDWDSLRKMVCKWGVRNSLLAAPMPTASTSQIMGFTESFEIPTSNIYKRKTMAGEFIIINKYLVNDLIEKGLWDNAMKEDILIREGSIQTIDKIPDDLKQLYKTAWEIKQKNYIEQARDRGAFICQSQSMNIFVADPTFNKLNTIHFYTWTCGLKTGMYYLRTKPKANTQQFTIDPNKSKSNTSEEPPCESCSA